jgi:hypothetical protein
VIVRATPNAGYKFAFWTGDIPVFEENPPPVLVIEVGRQFGGDQQIGALFVDEALP